MYKKVFSMVLAVLLVTSVFGGCSSSAKTQHLNVREINKHGSVILDTTPAEMEKAGIAAGDIISVSAGEGTYEMPVGTAYTDVDSGDMVCRFDLEDDEVMLAINYGSFAETAGLAEGQPVDLSLKEKEGYLDEYNARNLTRTDAREDYPDLTDAEFANFRAVAVSGVKENTLYRSSTPVEPAIGRNEYAMAAMEEAGIRTVINLDDTVEEMESYDTYPGSNYSTCTIINPEMGYDFESEEFAGKVKESVQFIIENDGPYLIHCKEGKDRTGILCAILESFAGASWADIQHDYMLTYYNYYGVKQGDTAYAIILNNNLGKTLPALLGVDDIETADLKEAASQYLLSIGLTTEQLEILDAKL